MPSKICPKCQLDHERLGLAFVGKVLMRRVRGSAHLLRAHGGCYAFSATFWDAHAGEFSAVQIHDIVDGSVYYADANGLQRSFRQTFNLAVGPQVVIPIAVMARTRAAPRRHIEPVIPSSESD